MLHLVHLMHLNSAFVWKNAGSTEKFAGSVRKNRATIFLYGGSIYHQNKLFYFK